MSWAVRAQPSTLEEMALPHATLLATCDWKEFMSVSRPHRPGYAS